MPTDDHARVSGRKLGLFGLVAGVALVFVVVSGIRAARGERRQAQAMDG